MIEIILVIRPYTCVCACVEYVLRAAASACQEPRWPVVLYLYK